MLPGDASAYRVRDPDDPASMIPTAEPDLERITRLAARLFDVPIATFSVRRDDHVIMRSKVGIDLCEAPLETTFCRHTTEAGGILIVPDATTDARFRTNPFVLGPPHICFYAGVTVRSANGRVHGVVSLIDTRIREGLTEAEREQLSDIGELFAKRLEFDRLGAQLEVSLDRFATVAATIQDAIVCFDNRGMLTEWNAAAERLFGYGTAEILGQPLSRLIHPDSQALYEARLTALLQDNGLLRTNRVAEFGAIRKDGTSFIAEVSTSTWRQGGHISIIRDTTERRRNEQRLFQLASLDPLTGLPNRGSLLRELASGLHQRRPLTLLMLDLDGFNEVNEAFGHSAGDRTLLMVADRLLRTCPQARQIARLGGDEFVVLLDGDDERQARAVALDVIEVVSQPFDIAAQSMAIGTSIGIALAPHHGERAEDIMNAADLALRRTKTRGKGSCEIFTPLLRQISTSRRAFDRELQAAFDCGQFEVFYQPQFRIDGPALAGAEALIRWRHPERGLLTPAHFIEALSHRSAAPEIGDWILRSACRAAAIWRRSSTDFRIGVNLFEAQLRSPHFVTTIDGILRDCRLPPKALELEIVENIVLCHDAQIRHGLGELRDLGVGLAFDDYGTGFASLSLLKGLPVTRLKIDRSFVQGIDTDHENRALVSAILYLAESFRMDVIAEGVETAAQLETLRELGCSQIQGYLMGRPVTQEAFGLRFLDGPKQDW